MAQSAERPLVYLIYGAEDLLVEQVLNQLKGKLAEQGDADFDSATFDAAAALTAEEVIDSCNTMPFLAERRLVIVRNADKLAKEGLDRLAAYAEDPAPFTALVLSGEKFAKNTKLYKAVERLAGRGFIKELAKPTKSDYPRRVIEMFDARGKRIDRESAELLVSSVGFDLRRLSVEVGKAVNYVGDRAQVTREDIAEVAATTAPTSVFEFLDALAARDCRLSLRLLADLLGEGESIFGIHAMSLRQLRDLMASRALLDRGDASVAEGMRVLGRPDWQVKRAFKQAKSFTSAELVALIQTAAKAEQEMKTSRDARLAFERFIVKFCRS